MLTKEPRSASELQARFSGSYGLLVRKLRMKGVPIGKERYGGRIYFVMENQFNPGGEVRRFARRRARGNGTEHQYAHRLSDLPTCIECGRRFGSEDGSDFGKRFCPDCIELNLAAKMSRAQHA